MISGYLIICCGGMIQRGKMSRECKIVFWFILVLLLLQWAVPFATNVLRERYLVSEEYDQREMQDHLDRISRRLQEGGL